MQGNVLTARRVHLARSFHDNWPYVLTLALAESRAGVGPPQFLAQSEPRRRVSTGPLIFWNLGHGPGVVFGVRHVRCLTVRDRLVPSGDARGTNATLTRGRR